MTMNNSESAKKKKESPAMQLVKEMARRRGDGLADQKILDHYRAKKGR